MADYSQYNDPRKNGQFVRDWGFGIPHLEFPKRKNGAAQRRLAEMRVRHGLALPFTVETSGAVQ